MILCSVDLRIPGFSDLLAWPGTQPCVVKMAFVGIPQGLNNCPIAQRDAKAVSTAKFVFGNSMPFNGLRARCPKT
jgi:hypothetical protein